MTPKPVDLEALSALLEKATPGELIEESFLLIHKVATGQSSRSYMSIPADPTRDADLIVGDALKHYAALRNAAPAMIEELRELRASRVPPEREELLLAAMDAATARAERDAMRAEVEGLKGVLAIIHRDGGHHTEAVGLTQSVNDAHKVWAQLMTDLEAARAQLATAREDALEEAAVWLKAQQGVCDPKACDCNRPDHLAISIRALKKTTKGGGA